MGITLTINNKIYNYLMKHKGPALLDLSKSNQFFKLQFDNFADVENFFEESLFNIKDAIGVEISSKVIGKSIYIWEKKSVK